MYVRANSIHVINFLIEKINSSARHDASFNRKEIIKTEIKTRVRK